MVSSMARSIGLNHTRIKAFAICFGPALLLRAQRALAGTTSAAVVSYAREVGAANAAYTVPSPGSIQRAIVVIRADNQDFFMDPTLTNGATSAERAAGGGPSTLLGAVALGSLSGTSAMNIRNDVILNSKPRGSQATQGANVKPSTRLLVALAIITFMGVAGSAPARGPRKLLFLTHSAGFKHSVIPLAEKIMPEIGKKLGDFETTVTQDCSNITRGNLRNYDAVMFYTTGELPISDENRTAFLDFIRVGKGFVGIHCATDTFYKWAEYGQMIGGYFDEHPWHQDVVVRVEDAKFPATAHMGTSFKIKDEIYQFKDWSRARTHVLLSLDPASVDLTLKNVHRTDKDFAVAWCHPYGKGRVFYSSLGHRDEVWQDERFQKFLVNGTLWAMGAVKSSVKLGTPHP